MEHGRGAAGQRDACGYELRALARWITVDEGKHVNPSKQRAESPEAQSAQNDGDPENGSKRTAATNSEILNERGGPAQPSQEVQMHAFILAHECVTHWFRAKGNAAGRVEGASRARRSALQLEESAVDQPCSRSAPRGKRPRRARIPCAGRTPLPRAANCWFGVSPWCGSVTQPEGRPISHSTKPGAGRGPVPPVRSAGAGAGLPTICTQRATAPAYFPHR